MSRSSNPRPLRTLLRSLFLCIVPLMLITLSRSTILSRTIAQSRLLTVTLKTMEYVPKYFMPSEFERATPSCKISDMSEVLLRRLDEARQISGMPFIINSAYRSIEYEKSKGRSGTSSHCKGLAVDLQCCSSHVRYRMLYALIVCGFKRIGIYENFIHADLDEDKVSAVWLSDKFICGG